MFTGAAVRSRSSFCLGGGNDQWAEQLGFVKEGQDAADQEQDEGDGQIFTAFVVILFHSSWVLVTQGL